MKSHLELAVHGEAPKNFIIEQSPRGHRISFIAKVGSKWYPIESITEHLVTRLGQVCGLSIANSKLRIVDGQVRFLSQYFLNKECESLVHGAEIFERQIGKEMVEEIAATKEEQQYYSFQVVRNAVLEAFPQRGEKIMMGLVKVLMFDALIGNQDRHLYNWGVIVPISTGPSRCAPIYDTARSLFWQSSERQIKEMLDNSKKLLRYVNKSEPLIGWHGRSKIYHFDLIELIWSDYPQYRSHIKKVMVESFLRDSRRILDKEFRQVMSGRRREIIKRCLSLRFKRLYTLVGCS